MALRFLAGVAGAIALLGALVLSAGLLLTALVGMAVTAVVLRRRGRPLTRVAGWLGAASGAAITVAVLLTVILAVTSENLVEEMQKIAEHEELREPTAFERAVERLAARDAASIAVERQMESFTSSGPFMWVTIILTAAMASVFAGLIVGTAAWICVVLLMFAVTGRWPPGARDLRENAAPV